MPYSPFTIDNFPGLQLADPIGNPGASAISNVDLDRPGQIRTRPGRKYHTSSDSSTFSGNPPFRLVYIPGLQQVLATNSLLAGGNTLAAYSTTGSTVTTGTLSADTGPPTDIAAFGTAAQGSIAYTISLNGISRWNGTTLTNVGTTTTPRGGFLATWARQARLVAAYSAINSGPENSRVHFSAAGDPETWGANDYVDVEPHNGETITGVQALGNAIVVFKQTRAYIFYGVSIDSDGGAIFDYRAVNLGDEVYPYSHSTGYLVSGKMSADNDFVYFLASRGVYRMSEGGNPSLISAPITPIFEDAATYGTFSFVTVTPDRVYVGGSTSYTLVLEKSTGQWTMYGFAAQSILPLQPNGNIPREAWMMCGSRLVELDTATTTDLGASLTWSYTSNFDDLGAAGQVKIAPESQLVGSGTATMQVATSGGASSSSGAFDTGSALTLGTAPAMAAIWQSIDREGTLWQFKLSGTGQASISRVLYMVSFVKPLGLE